MENLDTNKKLISLLREEVENYKMQNDLHFYSVINFEDSKLDPAQEHLCIRIFDGLDKTKHFKAIGGLVEDWCDNHCGMVEWRKISKGVYVISRNQKYHTGYEIFIYIYEKKHQDFLKRYPIKHHENNIFTSNIQ